MFTGLVEDIGSVGARSARSQGARLSIQTALAPLTLGESIAVMGVCLTVDAITPSGFEADASRETLDRTTLGAIAVGSKVHLERAMALGSRLGGHIVSGHVDTIATVVGRRSIGEGMELSIGFDTTLAGYIARKGSIAVDGVSLTVNEADRDRFTVMIVPHTQRSTLLTELTVGGRVNVEVDVLARYVARWMEFGPQTHAAHSSDEGLLRVLGASGYL